MQFEECPECAAKPGSPILCDECLARRDLLSKRAEPPPPPKKFGVGMPGELYLHEFGVQVANAFPENIGVFQVGSSLEHRQWRDVDVRMILRDEDYASLGFGDPEQAFLNAKWVAMVMAFSELGRKMTGLPIDFQIDQMTHCNKKHHGPRSFIGTVAWRYSKT